MLLFRRTLLGAAATLPASRLALAQTGPASDRPLVLRVDRDVENMDPAFRSSPSDGAVMWAVFQRLVKFKSGSTDWENDAAEEIAQVSPTEVRFRLKPGLQFTDGYGPLTAEDVKFSYERFAVAAVDGKESPYKADWANLDRVEVTDTLSGRIILKRPTAHLWRVALADGSGCIVSRKALAALGTKAPQQPVGSGPYRMTQFEAKRQVVLEANPDWKGAKPAFPKAVIRYVPDPKTAELAFRANEVEFTQLPPSIARSLRTQREVTVDQRPGLRFVWLALNVEKAPLDNPKLRQAIRAGLDVDQMLLAGFDGQAPRANALIQPQILGHWKDAPVHRRDVAGAKRLLAESGVASPRLKLTFLNQPAFQTMALVAQAQLREVGIQLDLDARDGGSYWSAGKGDAGKGLDLVMMRFNGKLDPNFNTQWFTSDQVGVWNWGRWQNAEFDRLNAEAAGELDEAKRAALVVRLQELMEESAGFVWLTYDVDCFVYRSWLKPAVMPTGSDWQIADFTRA